MSSSDRDSTVVPSALAEVVSDLAHVPDAITAGDLDTRVPVRAGGVMCGAFPRAKYVAPTVEVAPGDWLCLLSDGVVESEAPGGEMFGDDGVTHALDAVCASNDEPIHAIAELLDRVAEWHGPSARDDDETLVLMKAKG